MSSRSEQISALVAQLKAGEISKIELFEKLQQLQNEIATIGNADKEANASLPSKSQFSSDFKSASDFGTKLNTFSPSISDSSQKGLQNSTPDLASLSAAINTLNSNPPVDKSNAISAYQQLVQQQQALLSATIANAQRQGLVIPNLSSSGSLAPLPSSNLASPTSVDERTDYSHYYNPSSSTKSARGFSTSSPTRQNQKKGDLAECTFHPHVSSSSRDILSKSRPDMRLDMSNPAAFSERAQKWQTRREKERERALREKEEQELQECSFQPQLRGRRSSSSLRSSGGPGSLPVHERLYARASSSNKLNTSNSSGNQFVSSPQEWSELPPGLSANISSLSAAAALAAARLSSSKSPSTTHNLLSKDDQNISGISSSNRTAQLEALLSHGRPLFRNSTSGAQGSTAPLDPRNILQRTNSSFNSALQECTFQPRTNMSSGRGSTINGQLVRAKYLEGRKVAPPPVPEFFFKPQVNEIPVSQMPTAATYAAAPVYDRLSSTVTRAQVSREIAVKKQLQDLKARRRDSSTDSQQNYSSTAATTPLPAPNSRRSFHGDVVHTDASVEAPTPSSRPRSSSASAANLSQSTLSFLTRQQQSLEKKAATVARLAEEMAPRLQPALCAKSLKILKEKQAPPFLERVVRSQLTRQQQTHLLQAAAARDSECTFRPAINESSRKLAPRSVDELSRGDQMRRDATARALRMQLEQESLEGVSFKPALNKTFIDKFGRVRDASLSEGRLKILADPDTYVKRLQSEQNAAQERIRRIKAEEEEAQLKECSFRPVINSAPEYVTRIAQSMSLARSLRPPPPAGKPEWK